ncbi:MAG: hypothetical protein IJH39_05020 [Clostridia bacterium]|nr:hypothetical protein [Clostridia bacterium]
MNKKYLIIYHFEDNDGCCSAAIMKYYLTHELNVDEKDITLFGANYAILAQIYKDNFNFVHNGKDINLLNDFNHIIMTDVSFNDFNAMKEIYEVYGSNFTWVDHHTPIINESVRQKYDVKINGVRDTNRSALLNMYKYCYDPLDIKYVNGDAPYLLRILSAWDSFTFENEGIDFEYARKVNMGFTKWYNLDVDIWYSNIGNFILGTPEFNKSYADEGYKIGKEEADAYDERNEKIIKNFGMPGFTVNGRPAILLFMSEGTSSLIFKSVMDKYKNGICAKTNPSGNIVISLYNTDRNDHSFHCGTYLHDKYGGGGHEGAAGATLSCETFINIIKTKQI